MIAKVEVRKRLALYEQEIKERRNLIAEEMNRVSNACITMEAKTIWLGSIEYMKLATKFVTLNEILMDIIDMRCEEMLND